MDRPPHSPEFAERERIALEMGRTRLDEHRPPMALLRLEPPAQGIR